jgi:murein DD-endopeptidase MepM/ murein hydrolase activator NlpD
MMNIFLKSGKPDRPDLIITYCKETIISIFILITIGCSDLREVESECGPYPHQETSQYVLPYNVGQEYTVSQGNCSEGSHAPATYAKYAYDFLMPIGTPVIASRDGLVLLVEERYTDSNRIPGQENYINIIHLDSTIAGYVHLTQNGAFVAIGDTVKKGDVIGLSGDTGSSSEPHLHFHVQQCLGCPTIPVTFKNTRNHPNGLMAGESYLAMPF